MKLPALFSLAALCCSTAQANETVANAANEPVFVVIHADIKPDHAAEGTRLLHEFVEKTRHDKSAGMFELLQQIDRPNHITLVEEWESQAAYDRHVSAPETVQLRSSLQPMLGSPFDERLHVEVK